MPSYTFILSCVLMLSTCIKEWLIVRRRPWWGPIYGLVNEGLWIAFILSVGEAAWPILIACAYYIQNYARAIPVWYEEKQL